MKNTAIENFHISARPTLSIRPHSETPRLATRPLQAFLRPARARPNLHIGKGCRVTRLLVKRAGAGGVPESRPRAVGVQFLRQRRVHVVRAKKEVILAAGAIGSPHLLMLSGIGPARHLQDFGIDVVQDLPVGHNLQVTIAR